MFPDFRKGNVYKLKNMKKDNLVKGAAVLGALALMAGGVVVADAAVNNSVNTRINNANSANWEGRGEYGFENRMMGLTEAEKAVKITEREANRTANQAAMEAKHTAAQAAISAGDYDAWVAAEGTNSLVVSKVTKDNFSKFIEAHNLMEQARTILSDMGIDSGEGRGMGMRMGGGHGLNK